MSLALAAYGSQRTPDAPPAPDTTDDKCSFVKQNANTIATVGFIALGALATFFAYTKGFLNPVINFSNSLINVIVSFATQSPLHTLAVVVAAVGAVSLAIFLGKLAKSAYDKAQNPPPPPGPTGPTTA